MNYLQLVQRFRQETAYSDSGPASVANPAGTHARAADWVSDAYVDIQNRHYWRWLQHRFTLTASQGSGPHAYTAAEDSETSAPIDRFRAWAIKDRWNPPKCYLQSAGHGTAYWLTYVPWEWYRTIYKIGLQSEGAPAHISIDPQDRIVLGPEPNDTYIIEGEYHRSGQVLAADGDVPEMPVDSHMLIVYTAMEDAGYFEVADEILRRSAVKGRRLMRRLEATQLPVIRKAGPMA